MVDKYKLEYSKTTMDIKEMHVINWKILSYQTLLETASFYPYAVVKAPDSCFQMKFFTDRNVKFIYIHFMSLAPIDHVLDFEIYINRSNNHSSTTRVRKEFSALVENQWYDCIGPMMSISTASIANNRRTQITQDLEIELKITNLDVKKLNENGLTVDFGNLMIGGTNWDATIKSADGEEFKVHKLILASRCEVLKAHFDHITKEIISNVIETQWESDVLREVLTFLYTDGAPNCEAIADKLLAAADYYQLNELKKICEQGLTKKLDINNAIDILKLSELYHTNFLRCSALTYITSGRAKLVTQTEGWKKLEIDTLFRDLYQFTVNDNKATLKTVNVTNVGTFQYM